MRYWKRIIIGTLFFVLFVWNVKPVVAASSKNVTGTCDYDQAYEVLKIVNAERKAQGVQELVMDEELLTAAMMRAAECVVSFDHVRPNGNKCFTASDKMYGENIAMGYRSPQQVMTTWMNSQGHRQNILNSRYNSIGIGCLYQNGRYYWVQCFGFAQASDVKKPANVIRTYQVFLQSGEETVIVEEKTIGGTEEEKQEEEKKENQSNENKQEDKEENNTEKNPSKEETTETPASGKNEVTKKMLKVKDFRVVAGKKKLTLKWKKTKKADGYQIQISNGKNFKKKQSYIIGKNKTKKTITRFKGKRLKAKKKYYVRIRAYIKVENDSGKTIKRYGAWKKINKKTK